MVIYHHISSVDADQVFNLIDLDDTNSKGMKVEGVSISKWPVVVGGVHAF